jgi:hypothetical protein
MAKSSFMIPAKCLPKKAMPSKRLHQSASDYLTECEQTGDFVGWIPQWTIDQYCKYYGVE